jgi:hypothetical protein
MILTHCHYFNYTSVDYNRSQSVTASNNKTTKKTTSTNETTNNITETIKESHFTIKHVPLINLVGPGAFDFSSFNNINSAEFHKFDQQNNQIDDES